MREKLEEMRHGARSGYNTCVDIAEALFLELDFLDSFLYGISKAKIFLPTFEEMHPAIHWPREYLMSLEHFIPFHYTMPHFRFHGETGILDEVGRPSPGTVSFFNGLDLLDSGLNHYPKWPKNSLNLIGGAVTWILAARVEAHWGGLYPGEYIQYYDGWRKWAKYVDKVKDNPELRETEEEEQRIRDYAKSYRENDALLQLRQKLYLELADDLEHLLAK